MASFRCVQAVRGVEAGHRQAQMTVFGARAVRTGSETIRKVARIERRFEPYYEGVQTPPLRSKRTLPHTRPHARIYIHSPHR